MPTVSELIRVAGWRQGSLIRPADRHRMLEASIDHAPEPGNTPFRLIVITQDCDLIGESDIEPFVELFLGRGIEAMDPLCRNGRNPRLLHVPLIEPQHRHSWLEISIHDRFRIRKEALVELAADDTVRIAIEEIGLLKRWIAKRYIRPAFPDEFNRRLDTVRRRLEKLFKSTEGRVVTGLFLDVADEELDADTPYDIGVRITAPAETWDDSGRVRMLNSFEERLMSIIDDCDGVAISDVDIRVLPEDHLTLADLRRFRRLDMDYSSLPEQDGMEQPADGGGEL